MLKHAMMASFVLVHKFAFFLSGSARKIYIVGGKGTKKGTVG